jgi:hypothetical protein
MGLNQCTFRFFVGALAALYTSKTALFFRLLLSWALSPEQHK